MAKTDKTELLARVPLFQDLSKKELSALAGAAKEVSHPAGAVLATEGEQGLGFFLIVDGTAKDFCKCLPYGDPTPDYQRAAASGISRRCTQRNSPAMTPGQSWLGHASHHSSSHT